MSPRIKVTEESESGRNIKFLDTKTGQEMSRADFVKKIEEGKYENYHVRKVNGLKTPVSDPDYSENNNLD